MRPVVALLKSLYPTPNLFLEIEEIWSWQLSRYCKVKPRCNAKIRFRGLLAMKIGRMKIGSKTNFAVRISKVYEPHFTRLPARRNKYFIGTTPSPKSFQHFSTPHHSAMKRAIVVVTFFNDSIDTHSSLRPLIS
jgi:hypothetical protein